MSYTKKNLREVEDSAVKFGFSDNQAARFPRGALDAEQTGLAYLVIKPGKREAFAHRHGRAEEVLFVLSGGGRLRLDDDLVELEPFDAVRVGPGLTRRLEADEHGLEVLIFGPHVDGDVEMVADFWVD